MFAAGIGALSIWGLKGAPLLELPITKKPAKSENGKGGTLRSKI
jgi:hypothetical protein